MVKDKVNKQRIEIEWSYTPEDYFEDKKILEQNGYPIVIDGGSITATISAYFFDSHPGFRDSLTKKIKCYFLGAQIIRRQPFDIKCGTITRIGPDGHKDITIDAYPAIIKITTCKADLIFTDHGGIIHDTYKERINAMDDIGKLAVRHANNDQTARKILDSFNASIRDPQNEMLYLWEIWDALQTKFGNRNETEFALNLPSNARARLGKLANKDPLNQGRHRGVRIA